VQLSKSPRIPDGTFPSALAPPPFCSSACLRPPRAREKRSREQNAALEARAQEIFEPVTHSDDLLQVMMSGAR
jgi:hypothetical protein